MARSRWIEINTKQNGYCDDFVDDANTEREVVTMGSRFDEQMWELQQPVDNDAKQFHVEAKTFVTVSQFADGKPGMLIARRAFDDDKVTKFMCSYTKFAVLDVGDDDELVECN